MRKGEAVKLAMVSTCHEVQGGMEHKSFEFVVGGKISSTSTDEISQVYWTFFYLRKILKVIFAELTSLLHVNTKQMILLHIMCGMASLFIPRGSTVLNLESAHFTRRNGTSRKQLAFQLLNHRIDKANVNLRVVYGINRFMILW